jgi:protein-S-isoprenylcysteine O-methyltransferase Ste14
MKATEWEFRNRATIFGLIYALGFAAYAFDRSNSTWMIAGLFARQWNAKLMEAANGLPDGAATLSLLIQPDTAARVIFWTASMVMLLGALARTWASAYLDAGVVYASEVQSGALVADGPYRRVRNPLYFGNVLLASGMGALMSNTGNLFVFVATVALCYRLIFREESRLAATQGQRYAAYRQRVPRLWPALRARIPVAGGRARWSDAFAAEAWSWGFALAVVAFTITFKILWFYVILGASLVWFWVSASGIRKRSERASLEPSERTRLE